MLRDLYESCAPAAYRRARALLGNDDDAWDVVHEVFTRLADTLSQGGDLEQPMRYIYRSTTNACLNLLDSRRVRAAVLELPGPAMSELAAGAHARDLLLKLDRELDDVDRRILVLVFLDGLTQDEIAEVLGVWRRTVGRRLRRIRGLVDALEGGGER